MYTYHHSFLNDVTLHVQGRNKVITRYKSYHGGTHGSMMLTGDPRRWANEAGGAMPGVIRCFDPYMYRSLLYRDGMTEEEFSAIILRQLEEQIIYENPSSIAAMFLETVTGTNGLIPPPKGTPCSPRKVLRAHPARYSVFSTLALRTHHPWDAVLSTHGSILTSM